MDQAQAPRPARLTGKVTSPGTSRGTSSWRVEVANRGSGPANDVRLDAVDWSDGRRRAKDRPAVVGAGPNSFPVPVAASIPPGGSASVIVRTRGNRPHGGYDALEVGVSADGGRTRTTAGSRPGH
ncbi:hypothetical protein OG900_03090 [Streptomyces sp. NBC_00433]